MNFTGLVKLAAGPGGLLLTEVPRRELRGGEARITVAAAGICGTDLHIIAGEWHIEPPVVVGHEVSGIVSEIAPDVDQSWLGARVSSETFFSTCGKCESCLSGFKNLCTERRSIGSHVDGAFATEVVVPATNLHRLNADLDLAAGALLEPLACAANCLCDPGIVQPGDRVVVAGPGAMGLLAGQIALAAGGTVEVVGTERDHARLALADALGMSTSLAEDAEDRPADSIDVFVEASGNAAAADVGLRKLRRRGRYVQVGLMGHPVQLPVDEVCIKEIVLTSGLAAPPRAWLRAMRLVDTGQVQLAPLVSAAGPLEDWERLFELTRAGAGVKFLLTPNGEPSGLVRDM